MGNRREDSATPFSAIFFKTVLAGGLTGVVIVVALHLVRWATGGALDAGAWPLVFLAGASLGGVLGAGSAALALGCQVLARNTPATLQAVAAGLGGGAGVGVPPLLVLGPAIRAGNSIWLLSLGVLAGAAWAVWVTRPLRADRRTQPAR